RVVVGSRRRRNRVVVCAEQDDLMRCGGTRPRYDDVGSPAFAHVVPFAFDPVAKLHELALDVGRRRLESGRLPEVPRADQTRESMDVREQTVPQFGRHSRISTSYFAHRAFMIETSALRNGSTSMKYSAKRPGMTVSRSLPSVVPTLRNVCGMSRGPTRIDPGP